MPTNQSTPHARALALHTIQKQLPGLYREDLLAVQAALTATLRNARAAPAAEQLTACGEWLEEHRLLSKTGACHPYVCVCWLDERGHAHSHLLCAGTLAEYQAGQVG